MTKDKSSYIMALYCFMGEALCAIQHLEDALSHSITLKKDIRPPSNILRIEADELLEKNRSYTLGQAVNLAKKERLYSEALQNDLKIFLVERNWLIHKCIDDMYKPTGDQILARLKNISKNAAQLQQVIEIDLIEYSEARGMDMSVVRAAMNNIRRFL